jgi:hypothetical protein
MPLGYLGYIKLGSIYLLANTSGLNRQVNPLLSKAVWGAGWYNAAATTNYADSQQHFEGPVQFELQGSPVIWNLFRDWLVEQRVNPQSIELSPNGILRHAYTANLSDPRSGCWISQAAFSVDANALITVNATMMALKRTETATASSYKAINVGPGTPTAPLNPAPHNRNPFPGWSAITTINWPGAPSIYTLVNPTGFVLMNSNFTINNNTQIIRGCTGDANPVAVLQGTMAVDGSMTLWRDGPIPDPYDQPGTPFTASGASLSMQFGSTSPLQFFIDHVLLTSDAHDIQGDNSPSTRVFGFAGLGNGTLPPFRMAAA